MSLPVHLVETLDGVAPGSVVEVTGDEAHHAVAVRRLRDGEQVVLTDGLGTSATGTVASTGKRVFAVAVSAISTDPRPDPAITVVQALPKGERGELAVEVLTEVGVDRIVPWAASRSVAVWKGERARKSHARWQATAREAAKQSRRSWLPAVSPLASTADLASLIIEADLAVVLHEDATAALSAVDVPASGRIVVVVGPEGGIAPSEVSRLEAAGATAVRLGGTILRTSTAGPAAVAVINARLGRW